MINLKSSVSAGLLVFACAVCWAQRPGRASSTRPRLVVQTGHSGSVLSLAFTGNGKTLASASADTTVKLWDVANGRELRTLTGHSGAVESVAISADGKTLASGEFDGTVKLWEVAHGRELRTIKVPFRSLLLALSANGKALASGAAQNSVRLWNTTNGRELHALSVHWDWVHSGLINSVTLSPNGKILAAGIDDGTIKVWDAVRGRELRTLKGHSSAVDLLVFSRDGTRLASRDDNHLVKIWEVASGRELISFEENPRVVTSVAFSADLKVLASGGDDHLIKLWDVTNGKELRTLRGHSSEVRSIAFSPDGETLASGSEDHLIKLWDLGSGRELQMLKGHTTAVLSVAISTQGKKLASGRDDRTIKLWNMDSDSPRTLNATSDSVYSVAFSLDGTILASASKARYEHTINLWDLSGGHELGTLTEQFHNPHPVSSGAFSPDGKTMASGRDDQTIKLWDVAEHRERLKLAASPGEIVSVVFSQDGKMLASGSSGTLFSSSEIKLWEIATGRELHTLTGHSSWVTSLAFSPDGKTLASGSDDRTIKLWEVASGRLLRTLTGHSDLISSVAFSPDGKTLATGSYDKTIKLWDVASGRARTLKGHSDRVTSVAFNSDGTKLVSGSRDTYLKLWDILALKELASLFAFDENDWLLVTPEGLFDGSPGAWNQILWRFNNSTLDHAPVEAFFREYWRPGLLADIMAGKEVEPPNQDLSAIDIRQPQVQITKVDGQPTVGQSAGQPVKLGNAVSDRNVEVQIDIVDDQKASSQPNQTQSSGAKDLRLFRNGSLTKLWQGDVFEKQSGCELALTKPGEPRRAICKATVPLVAGDNNFTAYAFNHDDVKSSNAEAVIKGTDSLKRTGTAYIVTVGINEYANKDYNLAYAVPDAEDFGAELKRQQESVKQYENVEVIPLYNQEATKEDILLALKGLSGSGEIPANAPAVLKLIKKAEPEDLVMVYFAGHGTARDKQFYLIPYDLGYDDTQTISAIEALKTVLAHSISDRDLQEAFEKVDAGHLLLVIDACNSGQVLEAEEKRRGPMNSKGLAQLAYEKGIYILTASQSFQAAQEVSDLGHGLLTYVLVEEGLKEGKAEKNDKGEITERKWLDYATERVPEKELEKMKQRELDLKNGTNRKVASQKGRGTLLFREGDDRNADPEKRAVQRPRVFYRRELEAQPLVVAKH